MKKFFRFLLDGFRSIGEGFRSIGEGISTFNLFPDHMDVLPPVINDHTEFGEYMEKTLDQMIKDHFKTWPNNLGDANMKQIVVSYSSLNSNEIVQAALTNTLSWKTLKPVIEKAVALRPNEKLLGIILDEKGITFKIETINGDNDGKI